MASGCPLGQGVLVPLPARRRRHFTGCRQADGGVVPRGNLGLSSNARNSNPSGIAAEDAWCFMLSVLSDAPRSMEVIGGSGNSPLGAEGYESAGHHMGLAWHEDQGSVTAR